MPCTQLKYTLRIHTDLTQDIPALDIAINEDGAQSPQVSGDIGAIAYTPAQQVFVGGSALPRLEWAIACKLTKDEMLQLTALYRWQQNRIEQGLDARLQWIDRLELTEPEPLAELTRDIVDPQITAWGYTYGAPVVNALITKPDRPLTGNKKGVPMHLCTFAVSEFRSELDDAIAPSSVRLSIHADATPLIDSALTPAAITTVGNATFSTAQARFGAGSIYVDSAPVTTANRVSIANTGQLNFGAGDFTIDFWMYKVVDGGATAASPVALSNRGGGTDYGIQLFYFDGEWFFSYSPDGTVGNSVTVSFASPPVLNTWQHIAFTRASGVVRAFVDGTQIGADQAIPSAIADTGNPYTIVTDNVNAALFEGYIDELRVVVGTALYTAPFTPPTAAGSP